MKIKIKLLDLILVLIATLICLLTLIKPNLVNSNLETIMIILLIMFLPGYALVAALYPKRNDLDIFERLALSFGFPLIGVAVVIVLTNIFPITSIIPIKLNIILESLTVLTLVLIFIALIRRKRANANQEYIYSRAQVVKNSIKPELYDTKEKKNEKLISSEEIDKKISESKELSEDNIKSNNKRYPRFVSIDLFLILVTTILAILFIVNPKLNDTVVRTILGVFIILFVPGYSLIAALFPKKDDINGIERAGLSFGLSIGLTALFGLILKYGLLRYLSSWTKFTQLSLVNLSSLPLILSGFTLIMLFIAFIRRRRVSEGEKFFVNFGAFSTSIKEQFKGESNKSKILSVLLILTFILAISTTVYIIVKPNQGESFTEFYLLGPNGNASDYPTNLTVGQSGTVIIGVINHEYQTVNYHLVVSSNGTIMSQQDITLTNGNQTQIPYTFTAGSAGQKEIEFLLYKLPDTTNVYRSLHLFVNMS